MKESAIRNLEIQAKTREQSEQTFRERIQNLNNISYLLPSPKRFLGFNICVKCPTCNSPVHRRTVTGTKCVPGVYNPGMFSVLYNYFACSNCDYEYVE